MHTLQWALLPYLFYIVLRSFFAAMEKPMWTLLIAGAAIGFNALAGWTLIFGHFGFPRMELHGAGIATTLSSTMMFLGMAAITLRHRRFRRYHLFGRFWRPDWPRLRELWRIGFPMALTFVFETSIFYAAVVMMGRISATAMAAHAVAIQIASLSFMVPLGFGQVATVRVGRAYGAGNPRAVAYAGWSAYALGVGFMMIMGLLMVLIPRLFIGVFLDLHDPENLAVMELAVSFLALAALFQTVDGAQAVAAGMLRGMRDTRVPMFLALLGYWGVGLPLGALLAFKFGMGGQGIWLGLAAGLGIVAVMMTLRWRRHLAHISRTLA
jgi:MATE family multidrug resistance protein